MTDEIRAMLARQAEWQRSRAALPWAEKLRRTVIMRESLSAFRRRMPPADGSVHCDGRKQPASRTT